MLAEAKQPISQIKSYGDIFNAIIQLRDEFLNLCAQIAAKQGNAIGYRTVVNLLMNCACERYIIEKIQAPCDVDEEVDRIWRNLHSYGVSLLIERLKNALVACGYPLSILNEAESPSGRYDILLTLDGKGLRILNCFGDICVEAKSGLNISMSQAEKYMWDKAKIVIVIRFAHGDAFVLKSNEWAELLIRALTDRIEKARRIIEKRAILVPGPECHRCPLTGCKFNKRKNSDKNITKPRDINELLKRFRENVYSAIEVAVDAVIKELTGILKGEANKFPDEAKRAETVVSQTSTLQSLN